MVWGNCCRKCKWIVLLHYVAEGGRARNRYGLTSSVSALRDREIASVARYQRRFRCFISEWMGSTSNAPLRGSTDVGGGRRRAQPRPPARLGRAARSSTAGVAPEPSSYDA
jgi:hypothetical protein